MEMTVLFAGVAVRDYPRAIDWWTRLFGRPADVVPFDKEVMWRINEKALVYVLNDPENASPRLITIAVADLDVAIAELSDRSIAPTTVEQVGTAGRKATFTDPEGTTVSLIQV